MTSTASPVRTAGRRRGSSIRFENGHLGENTLREFFQLCDIENKGFISRRDLQRLSGELPLSVDELENVFDTLDSDGNGFLTLEEFSTGFSKFLNGQSIPPELDMTDGFKSSPEVLYQSQWEGSMAASEDEEEKHFTMLMENLGANNVFEDAAEVRSLWAQLRRDEPHLLSNFEDFLALVTSQIIMANQEKKEMESALKRKAATHDDEIQHLYEEMEQQIKNEKDRMLLEDYKEYLSRSRDLEHQLTNKEKELDQLFQKQKRLESQCEELHSEQHETKVENVKLKQTNDELARELDLSTQELVLAQEQLSVLQDQQARLHEEKEMEIYRLTEGLQRERNSLLKQLDLMREMNKHLQDEKDICYQRPKNSKTLRPLLSKQPSVLKSEGEDPPSPTMKQSLQNGSCPPSVSKSPPGFLHRIISIEEDHLPHLLQVDHKGSLDACREAEEVEKEESFDLQMSDICHVAQQVDGGKTPTSPRGQPVGKETSMIEEPRPSPPDRFFKIILVGNSSVGKTSLLRRFCDDSFDAGTSATVGIDYSVKTILVDQSQVALQLWDTAGQERYQSITKQFFRKADAVVVLYDITAEHSFTAVRQWLTNVKEGAGDEIAVMLLGNKTDKEADRRVQRAVGERLAKECGMSFSECSASSGQNVMEAMLHLARILKEQEDRAKEKTIQLVGSSETRRQCC